MSVTAPVRKPEAKSGAKTGRLRKAAATVGVTAALLGAGVVSAQAAGYVAPGQSTYVSTNGWGPTTICVYNQGSQWGKYTLYASWASPEQVYVPPYQTSCREAWWFGQNVRDYNSGSTLLSAWPQR